MYGYIYKTTNLVNGTIYIGKHKHNGKDNWYYGSGTIILKAIDKYGKHNFKNDVLCECHNLKSLNNKEKYYIEQFRDSGVRMYNICDGGDGGVGYNNMSEQQKLDFRNKVKAAMNDPVIKERTRLASIKGHSTKASKEKRSLITKNLMKDQNLRKRISDKLKGRKLTLETRQKMSASKKGRRLSEETKHKLSILKKGKPGHTAWNKGKPWSEEVKNKFSLAKKGKPWSDKRRKAQNEKKNIKHS